MELTTHIDEKIIELQVARKREAHLDDLRNNLNNAVLAAAICDEDELAAVLSEQRDIVTAKLHEVADIVDQLNEAIVDQLNEAIVDQLNEAIDRMEMEATR